MVHELSYLTACGIFPCTRGKSLQSCPTLGSPMDYNLPGSSVHGILQARILECVAVPSSRGSPRPRDRTWVSYVSCNGRCILNHKTTREAHNLLSLFVLISYSSLHPSTTRLWPSLRVGTQFCLPLYIQFLVHSGALYDLTICLWNDEWINKNGQRIWRDISLNLYVQVPPG